MIFRKAVLVNERFGNVKMPEWKIERPDLLMQEGTVFQLKPNAYYGRTYVNMGGRVPLTKDGCEELNKFPTRMGVVPP